MNKITVVCPTYNSSSFIQRTIQSIIDQDTEVDEIIFSDDGSTDNTIEIIESYIKKEKPSLNFKIKRNQHNGPGAARNIGIKSACNDWIAFIDSDDLWESNKISVLNETIKNIYNKEINFITHDEYYVNLNGEKSELKYSKKLDRKKKFYEQIFLSNKFSTSAVICRKELFTKNNIFFNEQLMSLQDYELWIRLAPYINILFIKKILGSYIQRKGNISSGKLSKRLYNEFKISMMHRKSVTISIFIKKCFMILIKFFYYLLLRIYFNINQRIK